MVMVIDLGVIWKDFISWVCMPNMKSLSLTVQKIWPRLKFFFLATDSQTGQKLDAQNVIPGTKNNKIYKCSSYYSAVIFFQVC